MQRPNLMLVTATSLLVLAAACQQQANKRAENEKDSGGRVAMMDQRVQKKAAARPPAYGKGMLHRPAGAKQMAPPHPAARPYYVQPRDRENYADIDDNPVKSVAEAPVSTFSVDVDTASYANVRRMLNSGRLPPGDAVRIEEMINYFAYDYAPPEGRERPFAVHYDVARTPWNQNTLLLRVALKGFEVAQTQRKAANLVFLLDVSGSMNAPDKLPLVVGAMKMLTSTLNENDRVAIVVYAGASGVVLEPTPGDETGAIKAALEQLRAGGSTAGGAGIRLAYAMAEKSFIKDGINRVILATDGDFNVGITKIEHLKEIIARKREGGIALTTLGFGRGNINDALMEALADTGNGNYAYIDSAREARKVLVEQVSGTLETIAKDVKIQIEFNPALIAEYRLIGYVNRKLKRQDFNNDKVDAGEIGAGHRVTALYEIALKGSAGLRLPPLRYGKSATSAASMSAEFAHLRLRYKLPGGRESKLIEVPLPAVRLENPTVAQGELAFAAAVSAFGQKLRGGKYLGGYGYADIAALAERGMGTRGTVYRSEFVDLARLAGSLQKTAAIRQ